jgi:hypothetical protein
LPEVVFAESFVAGSIVAKSLLQVRFADSIVAEYIVSGSIVAESFVVRSIFAGSIVLCPLLRNSILEVLCCMVH